MSKFQVGVIAAFVLFFIVGVIFFARYKGGSSTVSLPAIEVWGTVPANTIAQLVDHVNQSRPESLRVNYVEKTPDQFDKDFIETLARGGGPDAILIPQEMILRHWDKITPIPATILPERTFRDTYVQEAENYVSSNGVMALPFLIDPLVMYWNRDLFTNAGLPTYPKLWDEFSMVGKYLTKKDDNANIRKSAVALGTFSNIDHAREIFGALLMQAGNPVTFYSNNAAGGQGGVKSALAEGTLRGLDSSRAALSFFTKFSDPSNPDYSWNRSLSSSKLQFLSGNLATYFGFASELNGLRAKNPNLNFDVAQLPQARNGSLRTTYATMYGFSIVRSSKDPSSAYTILSALTSADADAFISKFNYLPPTRRTLIAQGSIDPYLAIFYDTALTARSWLEPDAQTTSNILQEMVESVTSGKKTSVDAVQTADTKLNLLIRGL